MDHLYKALSMGVRHVGFKDVGLPVEELKSLNAAIKAKGATSYLDVGSVADLRVFTQPRDEAELCSVRTAVWTLCLEPK